MTFQQLLFPSLRERFNSFPLLATLTAIASFAGCLAAAFIFTCMLKCFDGPQGASNEALPMLGFFFLCVWIPLCNLNAIRGDDCTLTYMAAALTVGYLTGASVVALHLGAANWSGHTYQLVVPAAVAVITATIAAACYVLHFVKRGCHQHF